MMVKVEMTADITVDIRVKMTGRTGRRRGGLISRTVVRTKEYG